MESKKGNKQELLKIVKRLIHENIKLKRINTRLKRINIKQDKRIYYLKHDMYRMNATIEQLQQQIEIDLNISILKTSLHLTKKDILK